MGTAMSMMLSKFCETSLVIDEVGFVDREDWPIPAIAKYSMQQVLGGFVSFERAICQLDEHRSYVFAGKTASHPPLAMLLQKRQMTGRFDLSNYRNIFYLIGSGKETSTEIHGEQPLVCCISGVTAEERNALIMWMIRHDIEHKPKKWGFFFLGEADEVHRAWAEFEPVARKYLTGEICLIGSADGNVRSSSLVGEWVTRLDNLQQFVG